MSDKISLQAGGQVVEKFTSYSIKSDLYTAADEFELRLGRLNATVKGGDECYIFVNGTRELWGIIDAPQRKYDAGSRSLTLTGRDLMGVLVDSHVEEFITLEGLTLAQIATRLIKKVDKLGRMNVNFGEGSKLRIVSKADADPYAVARIEPGRTIFETLNDLAKARGLLFFAMPDGTMYINRPLTSGSPLFFICDRLDGKGNNVLSSDYVEDIAPQYSNVTVLGQKQTDTGDEAEYNVSATAVNEDVPFDKPYVEVMTEGDLATPKERARQIVERQRAEGFRLEYKVKGHSQGSWNWQTNAIVRVEDEENEISGDFLIHARTFDYSRDAGTTTTVRLSRLGVRA